MNAVEVVQLLTYLDRAGVFRFVEGAEAVWGDALADLPARDVMETARVLVRSRSGADRWVTPGDVRAGVKRIRSARLAAAPAPCPRVDPDDVAAFQAARRALIAGVAAGSDVRQIGA